MQDGGRGAHEDHHNNLGCTHHDGGSRAEVPAAPVGPELLRFVCDVDFRHCSVSGVVHVPLMLSDTV
jgi:hypothetical protein